MNDSDEGEPEADLDQLMPAVYDELRRLAGSFFRGQRPDHTLQPTALVNEAYLRLSKSDGLQVNSPTHFFNIAAKAMRQVLADHVRQKFAKKRGGGENIKVTLQGVAAPSGDPDIDLFELVDAIDELAKLNERHSAVFVARAFGGLTVKEVAEELGVSTRTVEGDWLMARAWLHGQVGWSGQVGRAGQPPPVADPESESEG